MALFEIALAVSIPTIGIILALGGFLWGMNTWVGGKIDNLDKKLDTRLDGVNSRIDRLLERIADT